MSLDDLGLFLAGWRCELQQCFREDPLGHLGGRYPALADGITKSFPHMDALRYYTQPVTTDFDPGYQIPLPRFPKVHDLVRFCELEDLFSARVGIVAKFKELLWPGLVLRELLEQAFAVANDLPIMVCVLCCLPPHKTHISHPAFKWTAQDRRAHGGQRGSCGQAASCQWNA